MIWKIRFVDLGLSVLLAKSFQPQKHKDAKDAKYSVMKYDTLREMIVMINRENQFINYLITQSG